MIIHVGQQNMAQMAFVEHHDMIEALPADRADQPFGVGVLPGSTRRRRAVSNTDGSNGFDLLYAFVIVRLDRRELVWINVTANPTAEWVACQITEAFPWDEAPHYLIRDHDQIYGCAYRKSNPAILMVQSAQYRAADDIPGPLNAAMDRGILVQ
jgi:hypothetical protein